MATSLVTGGAGFIGSHLVRALLEAGDEVRVLDDFSTGLRENLPDHPRLRLYEGDVRDAALVAKAVRGVERVFHLAAMVSVPQSMEEPLRCLDVNERGTVALLDAARRAGVQRVVLASTCAVYGDTDRLPIAETCPPAPLSPYAASKWTNEVYADLYTRVFDLPVVALRFFNVYGPRQRPDSPYAAAIPIFISRMLRGEPPTVFGDGHQQRDFVFVGDVVRALLLASESEAAAGRAFNVCTGEAVSVLALLAALAELLPDAPPPVFAPPRPGDIYRSLGDPTLAAQVLGFRAEVSLLDGLRQTVEWMQR